MIRALNSTQLLDEVRDRIVREFSPLRVIVFGSRARGDARPDSDLDLLVVFKNVADKRAKAVDIRRALRDLPVGKDVIVTTPEEISRRGNVIGSVLRPALREGRTLFEQS